VIAAVVVSATISFGLTLLLARSVLDQIAALRRVTERIALNERGVRAPGAHHRRVRRAGRVVQRDGRRARGARAPARGVRRVRRPEVVERVLEQGTTDLGGEEVEVSVLFLDIRGFTALAERSTAREVVGRLNDFYGCVVPVLERHGGHANKFVGDGLLGVFGAPERLSTTPTARCSPRWTSRARSPRPTGTSCASASASTPGRCSRARSAAAATSSSPSSATP
jgi:class 3 adenylate cyclase